MWRSGFSFFSQKSFPAFFFFFFLIYFLFDLQVYATQGQRFPFPEFPPESNVYEYENKKECDSVMIGWIPSFDKSPRKYCVWVRENLRFDYEDKFREYFQCNWDKLLKTNRYVNATQKNGLKSVRCQDVKADNM